VREAVMGGDLVLAAFFAAGILAYLVYALSLAYQVDRATNGPAPVRSLHEWGVILEYKDKSN